MIFYKSRSEPTFFKGSKMANSNCMVSTLPSDREHMSHRFDDYSASIQQIVHCIETVEAQLRKKRQEIEHIRERHEALAKELTLAISGLTGILSGQGMPSDNTETPPAREQGYVVNSDLLVDQAYVFEPLDAYRETAGEEVDAQSLKAGVMRAFNKKRRSADAPGDQVPETNA